LCAKEKKGREAMDKSFRVKRLENSEARLDVLRFLTMERTVHLNYNSFARLLATGLGALITRKNWQTNFYGTIPQSEAERVPDFVVGGGIT